MLAEKPKVKILGERNTGTNYLDQLISKNFDVKLLFGAFPRYLNKWPLTSEFVRDAYFQLTWKYNYGWKHAMAPTITEVENFISSRVVFLALTKNPYSWLLSMHKRPYHSINNGMKFSDFIASPWPSVKRERFEGDFLNPIELWNKKNRSYIELMKYVDGIVLRYEDFLLDPGGVIEKIEISTDLKMTNTAFSNVTSASKKQDQKKSYSHYRDYYLNEIWREKLIAEDIEFINQFLDKSVMQELDYSIIST